MSGDIVFFLFHTFFFLDKTHITHNVTELLAVWSECSRLQRSGYLASITRHLHSFMYNLCSQTKLTVKRIDLIYSIDFAQLPLEKWTTFIFFPHMLSHSPRLRCVI